MTLSIREIELLRRVSNGHIYFTPGPVTDGLLDKGLLKCGPKGEKLLTENGKLALIESERELAK